MKKMIIKKWLSLFCMLMAFCAVSVPLYADDDSSDSSDSSSESDSSDDFGSDSGYSDDECGDYEDFYNGTIDMGDDAWHNPQDDVGDWYEYYGLREDGENLINNVIAAEDALEAAKAAGADETILSELQDAVDAAIAELDDFCTEHGWSYSRDEDGVFTLEDEHHNIVSVIGDPVVLASGLFQIADTDIRISVGRTSFGLNRYYTSDVVPKEYASSYALGTGWSSIFDSRIVLGRLVRMETAISAWDKAVEKTQAYADEIAGYAESDEACAEYKEEIDALLEQRIARRNEMQAIADASCAHGEKNEYAAYGYAGALAENLGCERLILVDDRGNPVVCEQDGASYVPVQAKLRNQCTVTYHEASDTYIAAYASGETRTYDGYGLLIKIAFDHGGTITFARDAAHHIVSASVCGVRTVRFTWNGNLLASVTDGVRTVSYGYSGGRLAFVRDDAGDVKSFAYDEQGRIIRQIKPDGSFIAFGYETGSDGKDRTAYTINENGAKETFSYDIENRRTTYVDHDGVTSVYAYDEKGRTVREIYADGKTVSYTYNADGTLASRESLGKRTTYQYDAAGHRVLARYDDGSSERWSYSGHLLTSYTDRDGIVTSFSYDARGNTTALYRGGQKVAAYDYNAFGQVTRQTDCRRNKTEYAYDAQGNCIQKKLIAAGSTRALSTESWHYDAIGRVTSYSDARGITHTYQYAPHRTFIRASNGFETEITYNNRKDIVMHRQKDTQTGEERICQYEYDKCHNVTRVLLSGTDGNGTVYALAPVQATTYSGEGKVTQYLLGSGADVFAYQYAYDDAGNLAYIAYGAAGADGSLQPGAFSATYERAWTNDGYTVSETRGDGRTVVRAYDTNGRLQEERDGDALRAAQTFSAGGRLVKSKTKTGGFLAFSYDGATGYYAGAQEIGGTVGADAVQCYADGKKSVSVNPQGAKTYYYYDAFGALSQVVADGKTETWTRDGAGRLVAHTVAAPDGTLVAEDSWTYGADARTAVRIAGGRFKTTFRTNGFGDILLVTDADGNKQGFVYDIRGRCIETADAYGKKSYYAYNVKNQMVRAVGRNGNATVYTYDALGDCTSSADANGTVFSATYDQSGRVLSREQVPSAIPERYEYDGLDRITRVRRGDDVVLQTVFSADGTDFSRIDANGNRALYKTDGFGRIRAETNRLGATQTFAFKTDGALLETVDFAGNRTAYTYERAQNATHVTNGDGSFAKEVRDAAGNILFAQNQSESLRFTYDTAGHLLTQYDERTGETITYTYDACGRKIRMQSEKQDVRYQYGKNGELLVVSDELNHVTVRFAYDAAGNEIKRIHDTGESAESFYDKTGRLLLSVGYAPNRAVAFAEGVVYDAYGRKSLVLQGDFSVTRYRYDKNGRLLSVQYPYSDDLAAHFRHLCAEAGLHFAETASLETSVHQISAAEYDALMSLCAHIGTGRGVPQTNGVTLTESFAYDKNGNLISRKTPFGTITYRYDAEDRLLAWGESGSAAYDANGNMVQKDSLYKSEIYAYNKNNRMERVTITDKHTASVSEYSCAYDAFGRRTVVSSAVAGALRTVYDGLTFNDAYVARERAGAASDQQQTSPGVRYTWIDGDNTADRTRTPSARTTAPDRAAPTVASADAGYIALYGNARTPVAVTHIGASMTERYALFADSLGTVRATYATTGAQTRCDYDVFGAKTTTADAWNPYGFAGKKSLSAVQLYDFGFRDYAPRAARFTTADPARDGTNWYAYCNGDSVNYVDLLGLINVTIADTDMHGPDWENDHLGYSSTNTVGKEGCVVSGLSEIVNALTGSDITPKDVNDNKDNFREGTDCVDFNAVATNYGLTHSSYASDGKSSTMESKIDELNNSATRNAVLAQVQYGKDADDLHWVGIIGGVVSIGGMAYVCISQTSCYDNVTVGSIRADAGWVKGADGFVYVPVENIARLETYTTGYRGDLYSAIGKKSEREEVELAAEFKSR